MRGVPALLTFISLLCLLPCCKGTGALACQLSQSCITILIIIQDLQHNNRRHATPVDMRAGFHACICMQLGIAFQAAWQRQEVNAADAHI
jgi:hypothetical protein